MNDPCDSAPASLLQSGWLARFRSLSQRAERAGVRSLIGPRARKLPAGGTEATGVRDYSPGDDLRYVDWKLCARRDEVLTKTFECEADLHVAVLLDVSCSMDDRPAGNGHISAQRASKLRLARQIAAMAGCWALERSAVLTVATFSGGLGPSLPALRDRWQTMRLLRFLEGIEIHSRPTDLYGAVAAFVRGRQRRGPVVVISDLLDQRGFADGLDLLRHHGYQPRVVHLYAPEDANPPRLGDLELIDCETGARQRVTVTERTAARYRRLFDRFLGDVAAYCRRHALPWLQLSTDTTAEQAARAVLGLSRFGRYGGCAAPASAAAPEAMAIAFPGAECGGAWVNPAALEAGTTHPTRCGTNVLNMR